jgi:adenylate cyclase
MERERKFLVKRLPKGLSRYPHARIRQGYIAVMSEGRHGGASVRIRVEDGRFILNAKVGGHTSRQEVELPLSTAHGRAFWRLTAGRRLEKTRYRIPLGRLTIEVDVFHGKLRGLVVAEVEFPSMKQLGAFAPPDWFGRDVTRRPEYGNAALAQRPPARRRS